MAFIDAKYLSVRRMAIRLRTNDCLYLTLGGTSRFGPRRKVRRVFEIVCPQFGADLMYPVVLGRMEESEPIEYSFRVTVHYR